MAWPKGKMPPHLQPGVKPWWLLNIPPKPCNKKAHWIVRRLHMLLISGPLKKAEFEHKAGLTQWMVNQWFYKAADPRLSLLEAALQTYGYRLTIEKIDPKD